MEPEEIKRIREKLGLTQSELAQMLGLSGSTTVSNIETGFRKPGDTKIILLRLLDSLPIDDAQELVNKLLHQASLYYE